MVDGFWLAAGGTVLAARNAIAGRLGFNIGGGFHHAFPAHGEGFCAIHDVAIAIRVLQHERLNERAMVVDCDVHHGNGTAAIFTKDPSVFTLSIHQWNNYPAHKPHSSLDINLEDGVEDDEYLDALLPAVKKSIESFHPNMLFYVGGADPYREDQLGGLDLTVGGLQKRDAGVFELARQHNIPVVTTQAGGYARRLEDTVQIHVNTVLAAKQVAEQFR
jgi:acetoin utilization deacetylase AcuC-like enzyme